MDYVGHIFRPPSEAESLLLQVTVGCSHNGCTYCGMYRLPEQRFRMKPLDVVARDLDEAAAYDRDVEPDPPRVPVRRRRAGAAHGAAARDPRR